MSNPSHAPGAPPFEPLAHAGVASGFSPRALLTTALPAVPRLPTTNSEQQPEHRPEQQPAQQAFRSLVSAACYLSFNAQGDPEAILEAIQILDGLATELRDEAGLHLGSPGGSILAEDRIWEAARHRWERRQLVDSAIRFIKSPDTARRKTRERRTAWQRLRDAWRRSTRPHPV